jgi:hypothetical protein
MSGSIVKRETVDAHSRNQVLFWHYCKTIYLLASTNLLYSVHQFRYAVTVLKEIKVN